ncbi:MAG: hypothetical protein MJ082_03245 [Clostridia bacterium]|nr:hypothetical protein [Clostridia bacterium]
MIIVQLIMIIFSWIAAVFKTVFGVINQWGYGILKYGLILAFIIAVFTVIGSVNRRRKLVWEMKTMFEESGAELHWLRSPYASVFSRSSDLDFAFEIGEKKYAGKFLPGITKGTVGLIYDNGFVKVRRLGIFGKRRPYFTEPTEAGVETVLVASAEVRGFYEVNEKDRELMPLDSGISCQGRLIYQQKDFLRQLDRLLNGYITTMDIRKQGGDDYT